VVTIQAKKLMIINILDILKKYSDEDHRLSQKDIADILKSKYEMVADRKAIKRNIMNLIDFGYDIQYSEKVRNIVDKNGNEEETVLLSDFYLNSDFTDVELRLLIDGVLSSKNMPHTHQKKLIEKIENLSNKYFKSKVQYIRSVSDNSIQNKELFYIIEILDEAISKNKKVSFYYNEYGTDKKLNPKKNNNGIEKEYIVNPYQMAVANGRYYLICNYDKYENMSNYRVDKISNIKILKEKRKLIKEVKDYKDGLNMQKHMAEHIYMFAGESIRVEMQAKKYIVSELIDWFGKNIEFRNETEDEIVAVVNINKNAMRRWALQYALHVRITQPQELVDILKKDIQDAYNNYYFDF
jgi:hypothetical protein